MAGVLGRGPQNAGVPTGGLGNIQMKLDAGFKVESSLGAPFEDPGGGLLGGFGGGAGVAEVGGRLEGGFGPSWGFGQASF